MNGGITTNIHNSGQYKEMHQYIVHLYMAPKFQTPCRTKNIDANIPNLEWEALKKLEVIGHCLPSHSHFVQSLKKSMILALISHTKLPNLVCTCMN